MGESTQVFVLLGEADLRRQVQYAWRGNGISLIGLHAESGQPQAEEITRLRPDVVVIEAEMDHAQVVVQTAARHRIPVVAVVRTHQNGFAALQPLEWGAVRLVPREQDNLEKLVAAIQEAIHESCTAQVVEMLESTFPLSGAFPNAAVFDMRRALQSVDPKEKVVVIGAGIGGPIAFLRILKKLKGRIVSPIVYSQNIAEPLLAPLAAWLESHSGLSVQRAVKSQELEVGHVYVVSGQCDQAKVQIKGKRKLLGVKRVPCDTPNLFDTLLTSAADVYGSRAVGVMLSGRGQDGCRGIVALRDSGGFTIVQDQASSWVYDRPGQAREAGGAIECLPIDEIAERIKMLMRLEAASHS